MLIMTLTRQLNPQARPVTFAVVSEKDVMAELHPDNPPEFKTQKIEELMRNRLIKYQHEFMEEFIEFKEAKFYIDTLELND